MIGGLHKPLVPVLFLTIGLARVSFPHSDIFECPEKTRSDRDALLNVTVSTSACSRQAGIF